MSHASRAGSLAGLVLLLCAGGCGTSQKTGAVSPTDTTAPSSPTTTKSSHNASILYGSVVDSQNGSPLAGATVSVNRGQRATTTDAFGTYRIQVPGGAPFPVQVTMTGYAGQLAEGTLKPGTRYRLTFSLQRLTGTPVAPVPPILFGSH